MQSPSGKPGLKLVLKIKKKDQELPDSTLPTPEGSSLEDPIGAASPPKEDPPPHDTENKDNLTNEGVSNQLVVYDPLANGGVVTPPSDQIQTKHSPNLSHSKPSQQSRIPPTVGAFTVQCAGCFKWRLIPTKEKYEEIREHILENPFYCETAREWRPDVSCNDPEDISQDGSRLWAIDKPNIAQPPPGWQRQLRIRGEGSTKFADVYYVAPSGKRLRSMVEVQKYLLEHPEYVQDGVTKSQFSFQIPRPLQDNYVRKRPARDNNRSLEPGEEKPLPLAWVGPDDSKDLQSGRTDLPEHNDKPLFDFMVTQAKKRSKKSQAEVMLSGSSVNDQDRAGANEHGQSRNRDLQSGRTDLPMCDEKPSLDLMVTHAKKRSKKTQAEEMLGGNSVNDADRAGANEHGQSRNSIYDL